MNTLVQELLLAFAGGVLGGLGVLGLLRLRQTVKDRSK